MARRTFYSFHYAPDNWRAGTVRSIGALDGNQPAKDNDWETVTSGGDTAIKEWISDQMLGRSATVVLVGSETANRKWINYEIVRSWDEGMGVVGIRIHGLLNKDQKTSTIGANPFDYIRLPGGASKLSSIVKCYNPAGANSKHIYDWISKHLANAVEESVAIRKKH